MPDLQTQLRVYADHLDDLYPDVGFEEILEEIAPPSSRRIPVRRGVAVALAVAIVVFAFIGGVALLNLFGGTGPPVVTQPDSPTTTGGDSTPKPVQPRQTESVSTDLGTWIWTRYDGSLAELGDWTPPPTSSATGVSSQPPDMPIPRVEQLTWEKGEGSTASLNGVTLTAASLFGVVDWPALYGEDGLSSWDHESRVLTINRNHDLTFEVVAGGPDVVEFRDTLTGEVVLELEAADPGLVAEQLTGEASSGSYWGPVVWSLHVDDGAPRWVEPPWQSLAVDFVRVIATPTQFVLVAVGRPPWEEPNRSSLLWSWRSADGRNWEQIGSAVQIDEIANGLELNDDLGVPIALLTGPGPDGLGEAQLVALVDGSRWEVVQSDIVGNFFTQGFGRMTGDAAVLAGYKQELDGENWVERCDVWLSGDGTSWELLSYAPDITAIAGVTSTGCYLSGDTVVGLVDFANRGIRWIGGLEP